MKDILSTPLSESDVTAFKKQLLLWDKTHNQRKDIWKGETDPYRVWIRETILQQTRVEQALHYYDRFLQLFPSLDQLAKAKEDLIYKMWEGLGYYNRCKNMITTAKEIYFHRGGIFPSTYKEIISLKGIGDYTASAILSFCYNQDYAVYDGNVERVVARYIGFEGDVKNTTHKKFLQSVASELLTKKKSAIHNQAIMDFGALVCKPKQPLCDDCTLRTYCKAYVHQKQSFIPYKSKSTAVKNIYWLWIYFSVGKEIALQKKEDNLLWKHLYLMPTIPLHSERELKDTSLLHHLIHHRYRVEADSIEDEIHIQTLSHRKVHARFAHILLKSKKSVEMSKLTWIDKKNLNEFYFPVVIKKYLEKSGD